MIEIDLRPDDRTLRQFGFIALVGFGLLATLAYNEWLVFARVGEWRQQVATFFASLAGVCLLFSLLYPRANLPIYLGLTILAYPIGFVLSYVIMGALFFGLIAPVALFFKLTGRDPMHRRYDPDATSYWTDARPAREKATYFRQF